MWIATSGATLVIGVLIGSWFNNFITRAKLNVIGGGGGSNGDGPGYSSTHIVIQNKPGFFGLKLRPTVILGRVLHNDVNIGLPIDRRTARECTAFLLDKQSGESVCALSWFGYSEANHSANTVAMESGEQYLLGMFARELSDRTTYFPYHPSSSIDPTPRSTIDTPKFSDSRDFEVLINYSFGQQKLKFDVRVRRAVDGRFYLESVGGGNMF